MIHEPVHDILGALWCGPAAISALTGRPISEIHKAVLDRRANLNYSKMNKKRVRGMWNKETIEIIAKFGLKVNARRFPMKLKQQIAHRTFGQFIHDVGHMGPFLVQVTDHYVVVSKGMVCDNQTKIPVPFSQYKKQNRSMVRNFWYFGQ